MSYFAKIEDGVVTNVIAADQDFIDNNMDGEWVQTSYNTYGGKHYDPDTGLEDDKPQLRKNYAGIGGIYDSVRDAFYASQPYPSWTLDEDTCIWGPPVPQPADMSPEKMYEWDEDTTAWVEITE
jgi:hypothetical protein